MISLWKVSTSGELTVQIPAFSVLHFLKGLDSYCKIVTVSSFVLCIVGEEVTNPNGRVRGAWEGHGARCGSCAKAVVDACAAVLADYL
ncbi:hypothetical protein EJB05_22032 [Eragrostis curvula]|uniref:Uncharacterized protein n=1 Tax=Eragrostis curvula TaxID=38414 RepID=A0A5J9V4U8_9POAL|nr:hypothetical protein EJB05_22032 [Eragrostis curvula]